MADIEATRLQCLALAQSAEREGLRMTMTGPVDVVVATDPDSVVKRAGVYCKWVCEKSA